MSDNLVLGCGNVTVQNGYRTISFSNLVINQTDLCCVVQVQQRVQELRTLLAGSDVAGAVSIAPNLLLNDVQTCLRPRMTRLVVAMSVKQLGGVLDAEKVQ